MMGLTAKQKELFAFINRYIAENDGQGPTFDQMTVAIGLKSKLGLHRIITALEERGLIRRLPNRARAIEVIARDASTFLDSLNPTARYVVRSIALREGTSPEVVMREWLNDWAVELRKTPAEYLAKTGAAA